MNKNIALVISCEHAVNTVPEEYNELFKPFKHLLNSHRGIDFGALSIAEDLKKNLPCEMFHASFTRLLIDCNRSIRHSQCFSEITNPLSSQLKQEIITSYYTPYRNQVIDSIENKINSGVQVWHFSIHSFTPILNGKQRTADIGLLYDPARFHEKNITKHLKLELKEHSSKYKVRMNYPYKGTSDGFTTALRKKYSSNDYIGVEIEINQALTQEDQSLTILKNILTLSLLKIMC